MKTTKYIAETSRTMSREISRVSADMAKSRNPVLQIATYGEPAFVRPYSK